MARHLPIFSIYRSLGLLKEHDGGMNFDDLIRFAPPPPNRVCSCAGEHESHFDEGAVTLRLAKRLAPCCALAGIEIALVKSRGEIMDIVP
jgi:hypothetical protein